MECKTSRPGNVRRSPIIDTRLIRRTRSSWVLFLTVLLTGSVLPDKASALQNGSCEREGAAHLDLAYSRWTSLFRAPAGSAEMKGQAEAILREAFAVEAISARILGAEWRRLHPRDRRRFTDALVRALSDYFFPYFEASESLPHLRPANEEWRRRGEAVDARYWLMGPGLREWFTLRLVEGEDGSCQILNIHKEGRSLLKSLGSRVEEALDDYSFPYMIAELGGYDTLVLEDFEDDEPGTLPVGWSWRDGDSDENKPYRVRREEGGQYLESTDRGESVILGIERPWNLNEFPYVSFRVRVNRIPEGADERDDKRVDSAAGIYFTLNKTFFGTIPESVKYVWSSTQPVGTAVQRDGIGRPWQVVFGTGEEGLGEWRTYVFDVRQAYIDTFGGRPPSRALGVGVLSDANSMRSEAFADYDDFLALRRAPPGVTSGVLRIVPPVRR